MIKKLTKCFLALPLGLVCGLIAGTLFDLFFARMIIGSKGLSGLEWLDVRFDRHLTQTIFAGLIWTVLTNLTMGYVIGRLAFCWKIVAGALAITGSLLLTASISWLTYSWMDWDLAVLLGSLGVVGIATGLAGVTFGSQQIPELLGDNQNGYKF